MTTKTKKFPKTLFVYCESMDDEPYFVATETTASVVRADCEVELGVYQLVKRVKATAPTIIKDI